MKDFLNIENKYRFEWNDLRAVLTLANVISIIFFGYAAAAAGVVLSAIGLVKDFSNKNRHLNDFLLHVSGVILNIYLLLKI